MLLWHLSAVGMLFPFLLLAGPHLNAVGTPRQRKVCKRKYKNSEGLVYVSANASQFRQFHCKWWPSLGNFQDALIRLLSFHHSPRRNAYHKYHRHCCYSEKGLVCKFWLIERTKGIQRVQMPAVCEKKTSSAFCGETEPWGWTAVYTSRGLTADLAPKLEAQFGWKPKLDMSFVLARPVHGTGEATNFGVLIVTFAFRLQRLPTSQVDISIPNHCCILHFRQAQHWVLQKVQMTRGSHLS